MSLIKTVTKNITSLVTIEVVNQISLVILAILLPRFLGDVGFGQYSFIMSFTLLTSIFLDFGLRSLTIQEVSRDKSLTSEYFSNGIIIKTILSLVTFSVVFALANLGNYPDVIKFSLYIMTISYILNSFSDVFRSIFYAYETMEYGALTLTTSKIIITLLVIIFLFLGYGLIQVMLAFLLGNLFALIFNYKLFRDKIPRTKFLVSSKFSKYLIMGGLPFGLAIAFNTIFFNFDIVAITHYVGNAATGWYSLPVYVLTVLLTFFYSISAAIFPTFSNFFKSQEDLLKEGYEKTYKFLFMVITPLTLVLYILASPIILYFFGNQFFNSILIFQILIWLLIPLTIARFIEMVLAAINKQKIVTYTLGIFAVMNIILDIALIPSMGYFGAIIGTLVSQLLVFFMGLWFISRYLDLPAKFTLKMILITGILGVVSISFKDMNHYIVSIIIIGSYLVLLKVFNCFKKDDLELFKKVVTTIKLKK
ncbi:flippase [uncultured Methanobacterium sp.]|uniref:flippase n=1 Tax=uncultured Methanobacterium sp. TaxID=176306 RepID=UPI002AA87D59|nr:flippase [uncultured Methanobacterium sp.]